MWLASLIIPSCFIAVNRNIAAFGAGTGRLSTDQKKKLLWGNKKSNPSEEIGFSEYMTLFRIINRIMPSNSMNYIELCEPM
jgi:hypothetical protein